MIEKLLATNFYDTTISSVIPNDTADGSFIVASAPSATRGWVVVDPTSSTNREVIPFYNRIGTTIYYRGVDRPNHKLHDTGVSVAMNNVAEFFNYFDMLCGRNFAYEKVGGLVLRIFSGFAMVNGTRTEIGNITGSDPYKYIDFTLTDNTTNYIYIDLADNILKATVTSGTAEAGIIQYTVVTATGAISTIERRTDVVYPVKLSTEFTKHTDGTYRIGTIAYGTWNGTVIGLTYGGTGQTTANASLNALLPVQTTHGTKFLQTDGTNTSWAAVVTGVSSVFGRTGAVVAATNDYTWAQINKGTSSLADITTRSHTALTDIGTNTHAQVDTHIANTSNPHSVTKTQVGLGSVENTALSTWAGTSNITTLGTIATGVWSGTAITVAKGGTNLTTLGTANQILGANAGATALEYKTLTAGTNISIVHGVGTVTINATAGAGGYVTIQEEGTPVTTRTVMNFIGAGITAADNIPNTRTDISLDSTLNTLAGKSTTGTGNIVLASTPTLTTPIIGVATGTSLSLSATATLFLGTSSSLTGQIIFKNSTNTNTFTLQAGATGSNLTFTLPTADGTSGYALVTNGSGVLSWASAAASLAWGASTSGASGAGLLMTATASSAASTIIQSLVIDNTQNQVIIGLKINTGTSAQDHNTLYLTGTRHSVYLGDADQAPGTTTNKMYSLAGVLYWAGTNLITATGTGNIVRATSPTLVTPTLGVAIATSINGATIISGTLNGSVSGANTGDQLTFKTISVSGQSDVVADTATDTLTLIAGTNITITTNATNDSITINSSGGGGGGDVTKVGTPLDNQIGVWTGDGTIEGTTGLTYNGTNLQLTGDIGSTGTRITKGWFTDLQVTNPIAGNITGSSATVTNATLTTALTVNTGTLTLTANAAGSVLTIGAGASSVSGANTGDQTNISGNAETVTVANEATDTTCFPLFSTAVTGSLGAKSNSSLTFNSSTCNLGATLFNGLKFRGDTAATSIFIGDGAGTSDDGENQNVGIGKGSLELVTSGSSNVAVGMNTLSSVVTGTNNIAVGQAAGYLTGGSYNTFLGAMAGFDNETGSSNIFIGYSAGSHELGSNAFYIDNQDRTNTAGDKAGALLYGTFNATASSQTLTTNSLFKATYGITTGAPNGGTAGTWKTGILVTAGVTADTTRYIQLDVGGTLYKLIIAT